MSGSWLGRGRGGRLALYGGCGVVVVLLIFIYRAGTSEMAVLRELHEQCAHQQEILAAQLQVIFEYKVSLEKSLAEEKNSNAAVKQELQQRATREKSLRDKDSVEAMQRFNSLQQTYKMLQTEHRDLQEECKKRQKLALEESNKLESVLQELRSQLKKAHEDKERSLEHLKNKYLEIETEKTRLEDRYNELIRSNGNADSTVQHLHKEVFQLKRELDEAKRSCKAPPLAPSTTSARSSQQVNRQSGALQEPVGSAAILAARQQVSRPSDEGQNPQPIQAPRDHRPIGENDRNDRNDDALPNDQISDVGFAQKDGNIVPVGPSDLKEQNVLPIPYDLREKMPDSEKRAESSKSVLPAPSQSDNVLRSPNAGDRSSSSRPIHNDVAHVVVSRPADELQALQDKIDGILDHARKS